jgi:FkbM family methyltransferase
MVSIRKAKQGFQLRNPGRGVVAAMVTTQFDREKIGLLAGGMTVGVMLIIMYHTLGLGSNGDYARYDGGGRVPLSLRNTHPHPHLSVYSAPLDDRFNAIALDIIESLDCVNLINATISGNKNDYSFGDQRRRRLQLQDEDRESQRQRRRGLNSGDEQHVDDGGFLDPVPPGSKDEEDAEHADDITPRDDKQGSHEGEEEEGDGGNHWDDVSMGEEEGFHRGYGMRITAQHLFCVAAYELPPKEITDNLICDAEGSKRKALLELWSSAASQMDQSLLVKVLGLAHEKPNQLLLKKLYHLWAPENDEGLTYMLASLNDENNADHGGLHGLQESLGPGKLFVDVGSCLGLTTLAVTQLYEGTKIVSIEPAQPNWLLQQLNLRCNLDETELRQAHVVLAGVGPNTEEEDSLMGKVTWRPAATTSTRSWTPGAEHRPDDIELKVKLRRLNSILAEANTYQHRMDVLNVDCEGCEYNLIPSLSTEEFDAIATVMGNVHWGYIPTTKLPSSTRGKTTHERLCQHENIARTVKECCAFPNLPVKSSVPGEVLQRDVEPHLKGGLSPHDNSATVSDVAGDLCDDFAQWALDHYLNDIKDDWGWFELTSQA